MLIWILDKLREEQRPRPEERPVLRLPIPEQPFGWKSEEPKPEEPKRVIIIDI